MSPRLATIGYEQATLPDVIGRLKAAGVQVVIDVRAVAASRRAGFSKTLLGASLKEAGIDYVHLRALGTPKAGRQAARAGRTAEMHEIFEGHMQEPEAQARLKRQTGRVVEAQWRSFTVRLQATPAGLLDLAAPAAAPDLTLTLTDESPWALAQAALRGERPSVRIAGDVQLAAEVQWLVDHVRWDMEEDLSRIVGDAPAHAMGNAVRSMADALRKFAGPPKA